MARSRKDPAKIWQVGAYLRLSREDGPEESQSITNQKKIIAAYLEKDFGDEPYTLVDCFIDDGLTGTDDSRAAFMGLIAGIEAGEINCVICKTLSRAFRNYADQGYYLESYFPRKKVRFISLSDPAFDTHKNPEALLGFEVPFMGVVNDRYAALCSKAIRRTFRMKQEKGEFIGAFPPYGFLKDPQNKNRLILDPETAPIKREMLCWILQEGLSLRGVAKRLNQMAIPNPTAYKWSKGWRYKNPQARKTDGQWNPSTIKAILLSQNNLGHMVQGKQQVISYKVHTAENLPESQWKIAKNVIQPTFTQAEYDALWSILRRDTRAPAHHGKVHLLSGFIRCADCGMSMHRTRSKANVYFYCRTYKEKGACTKHTLREDALLEAVYQAIRLQIDLLPGLSALLQEIQAQPQENIQAMQITQRLEDKHQILQKIQASQESLYLDLQTGLIDRDLFQRLNTSAVQQIHQLTKAIAHLEQEKAQQHCSILPENSPFQAFIQHQNLPALDRGILCQLLDSLWVQEGQIIKIRFRFASEAQQPQATLMNTKGEQP